MSKQYRIVLTALALGLVLALGVIFFIPKKISTTTGLFSSKKKAITTTTSSDTDLLKDIDDEMIAVDQEYNFNVEPASENLTSPGFATGTEALPQ